MPTHNTAKAAKRWTPEDEYKLRQLYARCSNAAIGNHLGRSEIAIGLHARKIGLKKDADFLASQMAKNQFRPGQTPWNHGQHYTAGGRSAQTRFRTGGRPCNWQPIGSDRTTKEGYMQRKTADTGCSRRDYVPLHHLVWRMHGREVPRGHALVFIDGNNRNFDIGNLQLLSRAELMRRNSVHTKYPKEIAELVQLRGALNRKINARIKHENECRAT